MPIQSLKTELHKAHEYFLDQLLGLQVGKASPRLIENIDCYIPSWGMEQKISQIANVTMIDNQTLKIEPWDKGTLSSIEKWIYDSGTGLTPQGMGDYTLVKIPPMTTERRRDLTKLVSKMGEEAKIAVRNIRHDILKDIKASVDAKTMSETEQEAFEKEVEKIVKEYNSKIDEEVKIKSDDVMKV
jgi:ribosome recycling factor